MDAILPNLLSWLNRSIVFGTVVMYGAMGETLTEKSGNLNLGTPGVMCIGGAFGFGFAYIYETSVASPSAFLVILIALIAAILASAAAGALYCFLTTTLRANQNVTGLALTIFGSGLAKFFGMYIIPSGTTSVKASFANSVFAKRLPFAHSLGTFGAIFFNYGFMMVLALVIAVVLAIFFSKTREGLNLRAVGENPAAADVDGISVTMSKYLATIIGSAISGLGGVYYILDYNYGGWSTAAAGNIESLGWLAVALVIFAAWRPLNIIWGSYLFGICYWVFTYISVFGVLVNSGQSSLLEATPYVVTIIVLILASIRKGHNNNPPESLGIPYFREDR